MSNCMKNANIENEGVQELCHLGTPSAWHISLVPQEITKDARTPVPHPLITSLNYWFLKNWKKLIQEETQSNIREKYQVRGEVD